MMANFTFGSQGLLKPLATFFAVVKEKKLRTIVACGL